MKKSKEFLDGYLTGFLGKAMRMSMDEPTEQALADVLTDFISAMAANECDAEHCAAPDEYHIEEYAAALAGRICRGRLALDFYEESRHAAERGQACHARGVAEWNLSPWQDQPAVGGVDNDIIDMASMDSYPQVMPDDLFILSADGGKLALWRATK